MSLCDPQMIAAILEWTISFRIIAISIMFCSIVYILKTLKDWEK